MDPSLARKPKRSPIDDDDDDCDDDDDGVDAGL